MPFTTRRAGEEDLPSVLGVQHRAFGRVSRGLGIEPVRLPPLTESLSDVQGLLRAGVRFYVAVDHADSVVGSVRARLRDGTVDIGRLVVDDGWQRQGVATALMDLLEQDWADADAFELFTGAEATVPLRLYTQRGYETCRTETIDGVDLVWLTKPARQTGTE